MPASTATDVTDTRAKAREKSVTRLSILEAARRLIAERGPDAVSLGAVALEAGFARATVYGYFKSKDEMLQAVAAYDLTQLAGAMSGASEWPNPSDENATKAADAAPEEEHAAVEYDTPEAEDSQAEADASHQEEPAPAVTPVEAEHHEHGAADDFAAALVASGVADPLHAAEVHVEPDAEVATHADAVAVDVVPAADSSMSQVEDVRAVPGEHQSDLEKILSKLTPSDPPNSEGSAAALARFDRRLRVVERTVGDLLSHQERAEKSTSTSVDSAAELLRNMNQRLEESERRQRQAFAELRASAREASRRLETLENIQHIAPAAAMPEEPLVLDTEVPVAAEAPVEPTAESHNTEAPAAAEKSEAAAPAEAQTETAEEKARVTYLTAARNSARIAAEASVSPKKPKPWLYRIPRKYLMFTCAFMSVVTMVIGFLVVQRATALANAEPSSVQTASIVPLHFSLSSAPKQMAVATPLDELSAMATAGNGKAQLLIGLRYLKGSDGIPKNPSEAAKWIARAAQRGEPMAQYWAGYVYQHGVGVSSDPDAALRWYEAAADQGNTRAMYNLGVGYAEGWAGAKDAPEASRWFTRAARLGFVDAQFNLAVLYERGLGVPPNLSDAYKWYAIAAKSGDAESKKRLDAIATQLSADDLAAAQRAAMTFQPTPSVTEANTVPTVDLKRG